LNINGKILTQDNICWNIKHNLTVSNRNTEKINKQEEERKKYNYEKQQLIV
jgi:hypothetical protein